MITSTFFSVTKIKNFAEFYASATKFKTRYFLTYMSIRKTHNPRTLFQFAIVASKKGVHKRAVQRNRARRRLKAALQCYLKNAVLPLGIEIQVLFMANRTVLDAKWEDLYEIVQNAIQKVLANCTALQSESGDA